MSECCATVHHHKCTSLILRPSPLLHRSGTVPEKSVFWHSVISWCAHWQRLDGDRPPTTPSHPLSLACPQYYAKRFTLHDDTHHPRRPLPKNRSAFFSQSDLHIAHEGFFARGSRCKFAPRRLAPRTEALFASPEATLSLTTWVFQFVGNPPMLWCAVGRTGASSSVTSTHKDLRCFRDARQTLGTNSEDPSEI